ncbi:MAG: hypothetical protein KTV45_09005 [Acidimicrobiia bacterium]|nr:hypothetical protein [Acidimicrobiia bacterium]
MPSVGKVINLDLHQVSFDLDSVPLDDLLEFRDEHRAGYKGLHAEPGGFMAELAQIDDTGNREELLRERLQEIDDAATIYGGLLAVRLSRPAEGSPLVSLVPPGLCPAATHSASCYEQPVSLWI